MQVPSGETHTFRNLGTAPARMLAIVVPAEALTLVERLGALSRGGPPGPAAVRALFAEYCTEVAVPPADDERSTSRAKQEP